MRNFQSLMEKGLELSPLLNSEIFRFQFDYDEWPSVHVDKDEYRKPYNESIFQIREHYRSIFHEEQFAIPDDEDAAVDSSKVYKITYLLNTIPQIGEYVVNDPETGKNSFCNKDKSLMDMCQDSEELELFNSLAIQDVIDFKWTEFAYRIHLVGCFFHFFYMTILIIYIKAIYVSADSANA